MTEPIFFIIALVLLLAFDLLIVATRASLLHTNLGRLLAQRERIEPQVNRTLTLIHSTPRLQASLGLTLTLLRFLFAGLLLYLASFYTAFSSFGIGIGILLISGLLLYWLEWVAQWYVLHSSEDWALRLTPLARGLMFLLAPLVALPLALAGEIRGVSEAGSAITEDELKTMVDAGQEEGLLEQGERKMIYSIFELGDTLAREIMVPRIDIIALEVNTPLTEAADELLRSGNSRVPVYEETVDNILGLLYAKDLLRAWRKGEQLDSLRSLLRPAYFVPEAKNADALLTEMQSQRIHLAIVVDEYGGVAGLVTLEDIVEEILGEIRDEYDQGEELPYQELSGGGFVFLGRVDLDDFNEILSSHLPKDEAETLGGFIYSRIGRVPVTGEQIHIDNLKLTVEQVMGRRIRKVRAERIPSTSQEEETHVDR